MQAPDLPMPILFHPLKHHLGYIRAFIDAYGCSSAVASNKIREALLTIGNSQLDLYTGILSQEAIAEEIAEFLGKEQLLRPELYRRFLQEGQGYRLVKLSDATDWVLLWGEDENRFVHIHPARYAHNTCRVKATALKTVIAVLIYLRQSGEKEINTNLVNKIRQRWLELPPVRIFSIDEGAGKLFNLIST
jgi:hypothetical protein